MVMMVSAPIESEWMMNLSWIVRLDVHISAALTACSSAKVIGVWFGSVDARARAYICIHNHHHHARSLVIRLTNDL